MRGASWARGDGGGRQEAMQCDGRVALMAVAEGTAAADKRDATTVDGTDERCLWVAVVCVRFSRFIKNNVKVRHYLLWLVDGGGGGCGWR